MDLCEFEASLVYRASSGITRAVTQRNPVLKIKKETRTSLEKLVYKVHEHWHEDQSSDQAAVLGWW